MFAAHHGYRRKIAELALAGDVSIDARWKAFYKR